MCHANSSLDSLPFPSIFLTSINLDATLINKLLHTSDRCPDIYMALAFVDGIPFFVEAANKALINFVSSA